MLIPNRQSPLRLTYCSNVHPIESATELLKIARSFWPQLTEELAKRYPESGLKGPTPFAQGLWLSAASAGAFQDDAFLLEELADALIATRSHAPTANVFPYGGFHDAVVKEAVYRPDWQSPERLAYSLKAAECLAQLPAEGRYQSLSTVPGSFKAFKNINREAIAENIGRAVSALHILEMETERRIVLAFEPEPGCLFETTEEWLSFFEEELLRPGLKAMKALKPGNKEMQEYLIHRHIGVCYDCCHQALAYEDARGGFAKLKAAGCEVAKIQLSSALEIESPQERPEALEELATFDEPRYLHQVTALNEDGSIDRFNDLSPFLAAAAHKNWTRARVHFHVPLFASSIGAIGTTQTFLDSVLSELKQTEITDLLEIETYSWGVMPERRDQATSDEQLREDILREYDYVWKRLT